VGADRSRVTGNRAEQLRGLPFAKMTGSGNDFVFFDGRVVPRALVTEPQAIVAICNRYNGIGADGVVVLEPESGDADVRIHYYNSDGTAADLCGNATLCSAALSVSLGLVQSERVRLATGAGIIASRVAELPEIDFQPVRDIRPDMPIALGTGEQRIGFALAGIPHLVVLCDDADAADLLQRGPILRRDPASGPAGANVNWVSARADGTWRYRTFERGVEGETLACGTGAVATAAMLATWGLTSDPVVRIRTSSKRILEVDLHPLAGDVPGFAPTLRGEGRVLFRGQIESLPPF
jgi:diaminopimelate epimerase